MNKLNNFKGLKMRCILICVTHNHASWLNSCLKLSSFSPTSGAITALETCSANGLMSSSSAMDPLLNNSSAFSFPTNQPRKTKSKF